MSEGKVGLRGGPLNKTRIRSEIEHVPVSAYAEFDGAFAVRLLRSTKQGFEV